MYIEAYVRIYLGAVSIFLIAGLHRRFVLTGISERRGVS